MKEIVIIQMISAGGNILQKNEEVYECYSCNERFERKGLLMTHRKREHNNSLGNCNQFAQNNCRFQESECW